MSHQKPILYHVGVIGHLYTASAVKQEFNRPVVVYTTTQEMQDRMTPAWQANFATVYAFPDFARKVLSLFRAMSFKHLSAIHQALEKELNVTEGSLYVYYDRNLLKIDNYQTMVQYQVAYLQFTKKLLEENDPAFVMASASRYVDHVLRAACHARNIPFFYSTNLRSFSNRIGFITPKGQQIGMEPIFDRLQTGDREVMDKASIQQADDWYETFKSRPTRPTYAERNARITFNFSKEVTKLKKLVPYWKQAFKGQRNLDIQLGYTLPPTTQLKTGILGKCRTVYYSRTGIFEAEPDLSVSFFYLPLHYSPEVSDMVFGANYDHHEGFVTQLAKRIPSQVQLYVKEHTSMMGRRPISFYQKLKSLYNVTVIHPKVSTFDLICHSWAVVTVTGTAGWEGYLLGKPVIVFGDVFYNFLPGVLSTNLDEDLLPRIQHYLANFQSDQSERSNAVRAYYASSYYATQGDIGADTDPKNAGKNARNFAKAHHDVIKDWGDIILGAFPDDL